MSVLIAALPAFLAAIVEFVEALTIVLAVGVTRQWRSALVGTAAAVAILAILIGVFGSALVGKATGRTLGRGGSISWPSGSACSLGFWWQ